MRVAALVAAVLLHAHLASSVPEDGARLEASPDRVRLTFSEPVDAGLARAVLVDPGGAERSIRLRRDSTDVRTLVGSLPELRSGSHRLAWRIVSADGHPVSGSVVFHVGVAAGELADPPPAYRFPSAGMGGAAGAGPGAEVPPVAVALRGLGMAALLALTGGIVFLCWAPGGNPSEAAPVRVVTWLGVATPILLAGHMMAWALHAAPPGAGPGAALAGALASEAGREEALRAGGAVLVAWALFLARRRRLAAVLALATTAAAGATGHAVSDAAWSVPLKALHLLAVALWLGGILHLATMPADAPGREGLERARAVSGVALAGVTVVVVTGLAQAWRLLPEPGAALGSAYGLALLAKIVGTAVLLAFGARHRFRSIPRLAAAEASAAGREPRAVNALRRSVRREVGVMVVVLLIAGLLAYLPLPAPPP